MWNSWRLNTKHKNDTEITHKLNQHSHQNTRAEFSRDT